jgi:hypothetical protein
MGTTVAIVLVALPAVEIVTSVT